MVRARYRMRAFLAYLAISLVFMTGVIFVKPAAADPIEPGWDSYRPGTVAVFGVVADLVATGFLVNDNGVIRAGNYDPNKFSVLRIDDWTPYQNKRFVDHVVSAKAPVMMVSPASPTTLWDASRNHESIYWRELIRLRAGGYPIGWGEVTLPNGRVTNLPGLTPHVMVHPDAPAFNSNIVAALNDPVVLRQIGRIGGSLMFPVALQGFVNTMVQHGLISMETGQTTVEIANCLQSLMYLHGGIRGAVSASTRSVGSTFTLGGGIISGVLGCKEQLERLGIPLDNTTLGLLHIADCLAALPSAVTGIGLVLAIVNCAHDADMAAMYLQGTIIDRGLRDLINLMLRAQPDKSSYRLVDPQLASWLKAQFPGPTFGRVELDYIPGVTIQVRKGPDGAVRVSVTRLQFQAMMVGYKVTGIVMEGPDTGKRIEVDPFPPEFVAWCRAHPDQCLIDAQGEFRGPTPKQVLNLVEQEGQQIAGGSQPAKLARLDPPSEQGMLLKFPEIQKSVVTSSYFLCNNPAEQFGCAGTAPVARPGQENPDRNWPNTGAVGAHAGQDTISVQMQAGLATRMTINGQPVTGTFVVTDSSNRWVSLVVADGNVLMTYIPDNDMAIRKTQWGWTAMWTDAHGRTWTAKARMDTTTTTPGLDVYEISTVIHDPETGNDSEVTLRKNINAFGPAIASERIMNRATGVEIIKDNVSGLTYKIYTVHDPRTESETRVMEVYRDGQLQSREIISKDEDGNGTPEENLQGFFMVPDPTGGGPSTQCIGIPLDDGGTMVRCDRGDGVWGDPTDPLGQSLPGEDVWCGAWGIGAVYRTVIRPAAMGCGANPAAGQTQMIALQIEEYIQTHMYPQLKIPVFNMEELVNEKWDRDLAQKHHDEWARYEGEAAAYTVVDTATGERDLRAGEYVTLTGTNIVPTTATAPENPSGCQESLLGLHVILFGESRGGFLGVEGPDVCFTSVGPNEVRFRLGDNVPEDRYIILLTRDGDFSPLKHTEAVTITTDPTAPRVTAAGAAHRFTYLPGQAPAYSVTRAQPNQPICWTSTKDGVVQEHNACYGQRTDADGNWSGAGPVVQAGDAGVWSRRATVAGRTSTTGTSAQIRVAPQCEYTWTGRIEFTDGARFIGCAGTFRFTGGNVVVEDEYGIARWYSGSGHNPPGRLVFHGDGDGRLVVYNASGQEVWSAGREAPGGQLRLQHDGRLVLYNALGQPVWTCFQGGSLDAPVTVAINKPNQWVGERPTYTVTGPAFQPVRWATWMYGTLIESWFYGEYTDATGRWSGPGPETWDHLDIGDYVRQATVSGRSAQVGFTVRFGPAPGVNTACGYAFNGPKVFIPGEWYAGCKGILVMQGDGNLVVYSETWRPLWASNTAGHPGAYAIYQGGDLSIYYPEPGGQRWLWGTVTAWAGEGRLEFQGDGNFVLYTSWGFPIWATNTFGDPPPPPPPPPPPRDCLRICPL